MAQGIKLSRADELNLVLKVYSSPKRFGYDMYIYALVISELCWKNLALVSYFFRSYAGILSTGAIERALWL